MLYVFAWQLSSAMCFKCREKEGFLKFHGTLTVLPFIIMILLVVCGICFDLKISLSNSAKKRLKVACQHGFWNWFQQ